jgi:dihydropteroate synthase
VTEELVAGLWVRKRPAVMGILNITPDSFSDGGRCADHEAALAHGERLIAAGADAIDVGGESTRPGAEPVSAAVEAERVTPVIAELARRHPGVVLSVDTSKPAVARLALDAGAVMVNDVTAGRAPAMLPLVAERGAAVVLMHMRGEPHTMQTDTRYTDVVAEVHAFLLERAAAAVAAGISCDCVLLDPGIGFGKDATGNLRLLHALADLAALGHPVVIGASRKSFIGALTGAAVNARLPGSLAAVAGAAALPRVLVRVHDVAATVQFLSLLAAIRSAA